MLKLLVNAEYLKYSEPPRMKIGGFWTFKKVDNIFGKGQQAVHNSGSSMLKDTPQFANKIQLFLSNYFLYDENFDNKRNNGLYTFLTEQINILKRFKTDYNFRKEILPTILDTKSFTFQSNISVNAFYISLILYFVVNYNFFKASQKSHIVLRNLISQHYSKEEDLLNKYFSILGQDIAVDYLTDICYGRYMFLELHLLEEEMWANLA